jgi:glutaredoxin
MRESHDGHPIRDLAGALALYAGLGLWGLILLDMAAELPIALPRTWYLHRPLWGGVGALLFAAGWRLQRRSAGDAAAWNPGPVGRRFTRVIVYSRPECHLCDDAKATLAKYLDYLPEIEEIDVDTRPELRREFGESIPVVEFDGQVRFRGRVDEILLRRLIEGAHVASDPTD